MNNTLSAATISMLLMLGACAESPPSAKPSPATFVTLADKQPARQICHRERPTGSDIPVTVCRSVDDESDDARNADAAQRQIARDTAVAGAQHAATLGH